MNKTETYKQYLEQIENQSFQFLYELVNINSQTKNAHGVNVVGKKCIDLFALLGFTAQIFPSKIDPTYGDYVFLTHQGKSKENIALVSHLDTVYSEQEEKSNNFFLREEGERLYGPGVCDIKGGTIVIFMVLKTLKEKNPQLFEKYTWNVFLNAREEEGTDEFAERAMEFVNNETKAVLVYEAGGEEVNGSNIVTARKGVARFYMETIGRQAHSGTDHHRGANALLELAHNIVKIEQETCYKKGLTFNIGEAQGGIAINRVPDHAYCYIDIRTKTQQDFDYAVDFIHKFAGKGIVKSRSGDFKCQTIIRQMPSYPCWPENPSSDKLANIFVKAGQDLGQQIHPKPRAGASDGSFFWQIAPTVDGLGPIGANDHCSIHKPEEGKEQEYIIKSSLCERALLNIIAIEKWLQQ
ncbi:M20/M25/M40 family metallo-hydrolase [Candidatus Uabimicrobium sp. HlEnr_7]|uniref:M20/M25/M40 family metallo-hydrolase n=1 Tax=Candidatus Uabimicrobium helgolandensis TaxID=3095367 RepID=UPI003557BF62